MAANVQQLPHAPAHDAHLRVEPPATYARSTQHAKDDALRMGQSCGEGGGCAIERPAESSAEPSVILIHT